ncbi:MAG: hypothetical protein RL701_2876 [Pseudomonadota bacterium]|jgi:serine/threonine-protein kinase
MTVAALQSRVGSVIDHKYEVVRLVGAGGMGAVYEARHRQLERSVALKFLQSDALHPELSARFAAEARAAGMLRHENIAAVYDTGITQDGAQYLVMELIEGIDCAELLVSTGKLPAARAIELIVQVCRGLAVVHAKGIVHRDLKPANLFLTRRADGSDLIKILDFGIAKLRPATGAPRAAETQAAMGTPFYMAPEQVEGACDMDARVDVYALGVVLYELLSGCKPHVGHTPLKTLHLILTEEPPALAKRVPGLAPTLCEVIARAMRKNREDRFADVTELAQALQSLARQSSALTTAPARTPLAHAPTLPSEARASSLQAADETRQSIELLAAPALREPRTKRWVVALLTTSVLVALALAMLAPRPSARPPLPAKTQAQTGTQTAPLEANIRAGEVTAKPVPARPKQAAGAVLDERTSTQPEPTPRAPTRRPERHSARHSAGMATRPSTSRLADAEQRPIAPTRATPATPSATQTLPPAPEPAHDKPAASGARLRIDYESPFR